MKTLAFSILFIGVVGATAALAAAPPDAPSGTMGMCKDGTYSSSTEKKGACRGHKGVKDWYGEDTAPAARSTSERAASPSGMAATTPVTSPARTIPSATAGGTSGPPTEPAAGGGAGKVWANTSSKVYHCFGDKFYGTTKHGDYMSESDAKAKGYHVDHGKTCG